MLVTTPDLNDHLDWHVPLYTRQSFTCVTIVNAILILPRISNQTSPTLLMIATCYCNHL